MHEMLADLEEGTWTAEAPRLPKQEGCVMQVV
jgi:hypothetical protein